MIHQYFVQIGSEIVWDRDDDSLTENEEKCVEDTFPGHGLALHSFTRLTPLILRSNKREIENYNEALFGLKHFSTQGDCASLILFTCSESRLKQWIMKSYLQLSHSIPNVLFKRSGYIPLKNMGIGILWSIYLMHKCSKNRFVPRQIHRLFWLTLCHSLGEQCFFHCV